MRHVLAACLLVFVFGCKSSAKGEVKTPAPAPEPAPPVTQEPAPAPAPEPAPPPAPKVDKEAITKILDEMDKHLAELAKGHKGSEHRDALEKLVEQLEQPMTGFDAGAGAFGKIKDNTKKFHDAQMKKQKDAGTFRTAIVDAVKELRATL